jgi:lipopolysaccharide export system permease protein
VKALGTLDRYTLRQWLGTFILSAVGVPAVAVLIDLSERFGRLTDRGIGVPAILLGQLYMFPSKMAMLFPAAVLFATVFTLNALGRHNELTAVKAGGVSFYRLIAPMMVLAVLAVPADFGLQELASHSTSRQKELQGERISATDQQRYKFAFASKSGWTWAINRLERTPPRLTALVLDGPDSAGTHWMLSADSATWRNGAGWQLFAGAAHLLGDSGRVETFQFKSARLRAFTESPATLMDEPRKAEEMTLGELQGYLDALKRSGAQPGIMKVELPLKYAVPVACLIVALFGAPLAVTNPRAGAAFGLAIALGTTLVYLTGIQIMKALGGKDLIQPEVAAWSMNVLFLALAVGLLVRVRS